MRDDLGDYQKFLQREQLTENIPIGGFLRKVNGVDRKKAMELFTEFISVNSLTAGQEEFINSIITYVSKNGDIERGIFTRNRTLREALLRHFHNNEEKVGKFIDLLHDLIIAA